MSVKGGTFGAPGKKKTTGKTYTNTGGQGTTKIRSDWNQADQDALNKARRVRPKLTKEQFIKERKAKSPRQQAAADQAGATDVQKPGE